MINSILSKKSKLQAAFAAVAAAVVLGLGSSAVRADSIDIAGNTAVFSNGVYNYTYTFTIAEGEDTGTTSYASVVDFYGLVGGSVAWTPDYSTGVTSTPLVADLGNYTGFDDPGQADLEVKFTTNVPDPIQGGAGPIVLGTLTATSLYAPGSGSYTSFDNVLAGGTDPNHGGALVPVLPAPIPSPLPASMQGGLALLGALALRKGSKVLFAV